jgi:UPF0755 protein
MTYKISKRRSRIPRRVWGLLIALVILVICGTIVSEAIYNHDLKPVNSSQTQKLFEVGEGNSVKQIAKNLQKDNLIKSAWAFDLYAHMHDQANSLQAGTYDISPSNSVSQVVGILTQGKVATKLVTILPGKSISQIKANLINDGFSPSSVSLALSPSQYANMPVLAFKPANVSTLEGLLWPDSFQKQADTSPEVIIHESLNEMAEHLTPAVQSAFAAEGLNTYQGITLASIVSQEDGKASDQSQIAQVFLTRLKANMPLGSDATTIYGSVSAGQSPSLTYNSPYNTYLHTGLPPTPIATITSSALNAASHPASTSWLYFVTGDNGTTYFATTLAQHQQQTAQYCHKLCSSE